jgi:hypothetical protein
MNSYFDGNTILVISTTFAVSMKLTGSMVTHSGLACWTEGAGENNPRIIDTIETEFTTMISVLWHHR